MAETNIEPGSVWADNYQGNLGRTVRVDEVDGRYVYATVVTNSTHAQKQLDGGSHWHRDMRGQKTRILRKAFRNGPGRTGYSPVEEVASDATAG